MTKSLLVLSLLSLLNIPVSAQDSSNETVGRIYGGVEQLDTGMRGFHLGILGGDKRGGAYFDMSFMGTMPPEDQTYDFHPSVFNDQVLNREVERVFKWSAGFAINVKFLFVTIGGGKRIRETYTKLRDPLEILSSNGVYYVRNDDREAQASIDLGGGLVIAHKYLLQGRYSRFKSGSSIAIAVGFQTR